VPLSQRTPVDSPANEHAALSMDASDDVVPATDASEQASLAGIAPRLFSEGVDDEVSPGSLASRLFSEAVDDDVDFMYVPSEEELADRARETRDERLSRQSKALQRAMFAMLRQLRAFDRELEGDSHASATSSE
jgi:hypothetical protein